MNRITVLFNSYNESHRCENLKNLFVFSSNKCSVDIWYCLIKTKSDLTCHTNETMGFRVRSTGGWVLVLLFTHWWCPCNPASASRTWHPPHWVVGRVQVTPAEYLLPLLACNINTFSCAISLVVASRYQWLHITNVFPVLKMTFID